MIECFICGKRIEDPKRGWRSTRPSSASATTTNPPACGGTRPLRARRMHPGGYLTDRERELAQRLRGPRREET